VKIAAIAKAATNAPNTVNSRVWGGRPRRGGGRGAIRHRPRYFDEATYADLTRTIRPHALTRMQTARTAGVHTDLPRVVGSTSTGFARHAGATAGLKLTFEVDHLAEPNQGRW